MPPLVLIGGLLGMLRPSSASKMTELWLFIAHVYGWLLLLQRLKCIVIG